jgi:hypothetical protein
VGFVSSKVSADPETNSLVLFVSPSEYEGLRAVIARLDLERRQVQISAVVAEVSLRRVRDVGVNWQAMTSGGVVGSFRGGLTEEGLLSYLAGGHFVVGAVGPNTRTIRVAGQDIQVPEFFAFLSALQDNSDFNLISAPRVLTQDNKEAIMNVGQVVPFATGGRLDAFGQPLVTFDYREVGIKLQVTPHVNQSGKIRMDIDQEIQEVTDYLQQEMAGVGFSAPSAPSTRFGVCRSSRTCPCWAGSSGRRAPTNRRPPSSSRSPPRLWIPTRSWAHWTNPSPPTSKAKATPENSSPKTARPVRPGRRWARSQHFPVSACRTSVSPRMWDRGARADPSSRCATRNPAPWSWS